VAERNDISVDFNVSPRIIEVAAPSTELTMQDLVDTLRVLEDDLPRGIVEPKLTDASGKQPLGGGVSVGITVSLQDAQVTFEARTTPAETGTHTGGTSTTQLIDSAADFVAAGVSRGSLIVNFTDQSIVDVLEVVNPNTLLIRGSLTGGIGNNFEFGDVYKVWNEVQANVFGGNLTAVDDVGSEISPVFPSAFVQIVRTASSSATITDLDEVIQQLRLGAFQGAIHLDDVNGQPLSTAVEDSFPLGTPGNPVSNIADARTLANFYNLRAYQIANGDYTLAESHIDWIFEGATGPFNSTITLGSQSVDRSAFDRLTVDGTGSGTFGAQNCVLDGVTGCSIGAQTTGFLGTTTLPAAGFLTAVQCFSSVPGATAPIFVYGAGGGAMQFRGWSGPCEIQGSNNAFHAASVDLNSGLLVLGATNTAGVIVVRGAGHLDDNSAGATVVRLGLVDAEELTKVRKVLTNTLTTDPGTGTLTILDDDDVSTFLSGLMYEDIAQSQLYRGLGAEVRRRLT
jgi:hypothetical protein